MTETNAKKEKAPKKSFFKSLKAEFKKIVWPNKKTLAKETTAVFVVSIVLGAIIMFIDFLVEYGVDFLVSIK